MKNNNFPAAQATFRQKVWFVFEAVNVRLRFVLILVLTGLVIGYWDTISNYYEKYTRPKNFADTVLVSNIEYFCPMHPNVIRDAPGSCPICGMPLSQRHKGESDGELPPEILGRVQLSPYRIALAGVKTSAVDYFPLEKLVEVPGTVEFDERKLARISARIAGRIDNLFVNYTGTTVKQGDALAKIYSPQLLSTIDEFLNVSRQGKNIFKGVAGFEETAGVGWSFVDSARKRLRYLGITDSQIKEIERTGRADPDMLITSPLSGIVTKKYVVEGQYVDEGTPLFDVANLTVVWMQAKAYEEDVRYLKVGQRVSITTAAWPNENFSGTVAFIDYVVNRNTRTVNVRVDVENTDLKLKPGMFLTAAIKAPVSAAGEVLVVPETAVIDTGTKKIVYVERETGIFDAVEIASGGRSGEYYPLISGLKKGDRVVSAGAFLIDAESRLNPAKRR